jgi:surface polysaccharide O-acyltransferase-like enzyme
MSSVAVWRNIGVMRGVGIALVALNHAAMGAFGVLHQAPPPSGPTTLQVVVEVITRGLTPVCLPLFLFASGYFTLRFSSTWSLALANARRILLRFLLWSIPGLVVVEALAHHPLDWRETVWTFVGGPWPTYWFLLLLVQLSLLAPWLVRLVKEAPALALSVALALELGSIVVAGFAASGHPVVPSHFVLWHVPAFVAGMWLSAHGTALVDFVSRHRVGFGVVGVAAALLSCAESVWLGGIVGDGGPGSYVYAGERVSLQVFAVVTILLLAAMPPSVGRVHKVFDWIGMRSLAVLLVMYPTVRLTTAALWHVDQLVFGVVRDNAVPPAWLTNVALVPVLFVVALGVPVAVYHLVETRLGPRVRTFLFA